MSVHEDTYLNRIPYKLTNALKGDLDPDNRWKQLLMAVESSNEDGPPLDPDLKDQLDMCPQRRESPTEKLLSELGHKGYRVHHLRIWLRAQGLIRAVELLEGGDRMTGHKTARRSPSTNDSTDEPPAKYRCSQSSEGSALDRFKSAGLRRVDLVDSISQHTKFRRMRTEEAQPDVSHTPSSEDDTPLEGEGGPYHRHGIVGGGNTRHGETTASGGGEGSGSQEKVSHEKVLKEHAQEFLQEMNAKAVAPSLRVLDLIPESVEHSIEQSKDPKEANVHLLTFLKEGATEEQVLGVFEDASREACYGKMNAFAAKILKRLQ